MPENQPPPAPAAVEEPVYAVEDPVYYVENVDGDDFTFYLSAPGNEPLLREEGTGQDGRARSQKEKFSYARPLTVVRCSPLFKKGDVKDARKFLARLRRAAADPNAPWARRFGMPPFSERISEALKRRKAAPPADLLRQVIDELNGVLRSPLRTAFDAHTLPGGLEKFSEKGRRACARRLNLDGYFGGAVEPVRLDPSSVTGRAIVSRSYRGRLLSVTFRVKKAGTSYRPGASTSAKFPVSMKGYCDALYRAIAVVKEMRGLLVVTGATNSAKSEIATGLIDRCLEEWKGKNDGKRPHLVTFEDPVEKFYAAAAAGRLDRYRSVETEAAARLGVDYTPRERGNAGERGKDVESLRDALTDALRQTPTVFFVGETREKAFWRQLIDFAGTGHLIVTTAHAGSLSEAMHKIFEALRVRTPAERSEIANRLLGVVHVRRHPRILVPALWRRTPTGKNALTAEGLSSLLPYTPDEGDAKVGCLGRFWFAQRLTARARKLTPGEVEDIKRSAIAWDLEGV